MRSDLPSARNPEIRTGIFQDRQHVPIAYLGMFYLLRPDIG